MNKLKLFLHVVGIVECTLTRTPIYRDTNTVCNNDRRPAWEIHFSGHDRLLTSATLVCAIDDDIKDDYAADVIKDMFYFNWDREHQVGCFYLRIGDLPFDEVLRIQDHVTGVFRGTDEAGITEIAPFQFHVTTQMQERFHLHENTFTIEEYDERNKQMPNRWTKDPVLLAFRHDASQQPDECDLCKFAIAEPSAKFYDQSDTELSLPNPFKIDPFNKIYVDEKFSPSLNAEQVRRVQFDVSIMPPNVQPLMETITVHINDINDHAPTAVFNPFTWSNRPDVAVGELRITDLDTPSSYSVKLLPNKLFKLGEEKILSDNEKAFNIILVDPIDICLINYDGTLAALITEDDTISPLTIQTDISINFADLRKMCVDSPIDPGALVGCTKLLTQVKLYDSTYCPSSTKCELLVSVKPDDITILTHPTEKNVFQICSNSDDCIDDVEIIACDPDNNNCTSARKHITTCGICIWCIIFLVLLYLFYILLILLLLFWFKLWCCAGWITRYYNFFCCCHRTGSGYIERFPRTATCFWIYYLVLVTGWFLLLSFLCLSSFAAVSAAYIFFFWFYAVLLLLLLLYLAWWSYKYKNYKKIVRPTTPSPLLSPSPIPPYNDVSIQKEERAILVQQKKVRPHGDLGSILTTYAASADREEYSFNANFTSQIASDNSISFSNLTTIPGGHSDGRELDIVIMIDGSDSFGETASTTEDSFKIMLSWIHHFLTKLDDEQNFDAIFATCYQFSGLKQAAWYVEGSDGKDERSKMLHYERFFGPQNISKMDRLEQKRVLKDGFSTIIPLGGSDFFYLCLNDVIIDRADKLMNIKQTTTSSMNSEVNIQGRESALIVISDGDWDEGNVRRKGDNTRIRSEETVQKATDMFDQIHFMIAPSARFSAERHEYLQNRFQKPSERAIFVIDNKRKLYEQIQKGGESIIQSLTYNKDAIYQQHAVLRNEQHHQTHQDQEIISKTVIV